MYIRKIKIHVLDQKIDEIKYNDDIIIFVRKFCVQKNYFVYKNWFQNDKTLMEN